MKRMKLFAYVAVAAMFGMVSCNTQEDAMVTNVEQNLEVSASDNGRIIPGQYIVVFNEGVYDTQLKSVGNDYDSRTKAMRGEVENFFSSINPNKALPEIPYVYGTTVVGFAARLDDATLELVRKDARVKYVEADRIISIGTPNVEVGVKAQTVPWGITRVNGGVDATGKVAWVIDSGIDLDHADLNVDVARSKTFVLRTKSADDENGHGTHCAGTIAAKNNTVGVIGVAANATVVAVRVLDRRGSGSNSGVIAGVDYVGATGKVGDVANMSLGGGVSTALDAAVVAAASKGVIFCLAAGNETDNANNHSPARANGNNVYTISASDASDKFASFSNFGNPPVDYCAPGVSIYSTYKSGGYATLSGTSMATPHAAGVFLLGAARNGGYVKSDPDGNADPILVH